MKRNPILVAIDGYTDLAEALRLAREVQHHVGGVKLGMQFFTAFGPRGVTKMREMLPNHIIFFDQKWKDIPATVADVVRTAANLGIDIANVHADGGPKMMRAAAQAAQECNDKGQPIKLIAVTVLTSMDEEELYAVGHPRSRDGSTAAVLVAGHAQTTQECGLAGVVCSPLEVAAIRAAHGKNFLTVVPGIRPMGAEANDQARVATPKAAMAAGADYLVIGRPIRSQPDPAAAAAAILESIG